MAAKTAGECCLRWTDHNSLLQIVCNNLLATEKFTDVTLYCEGRSLKCHKFILSACSAYFDKILSDAPTEHPVVILRDVQYWQMQAILQFIYKGELTTDETKLSSLVELAHSLQIKGIGEFGTSLEEPTDTVNKEKQETASEIKEMKEYLSLDNNISTLSERLITLPTESQEILRETLTASIDASDYSLQETEVEYSFQPDPLVDDSEHIDQPILVEYGGSNTGRRKKRPAESEASSSDASMSIMTINPGYKRYSEENLLAAVKAVLDEGIKQADACVKYGIPFTTLTRKIRLYAACGGRLPRYSSRRRRSKDRSDVSLALSIGNELDAAINNENLATDERVVLVVNESAAPKAPNKQYKTYTQENLKAAISAVVNRGVRLQDASHEYKIPLTTLTRKIRSPNPKKAHAPDAT